MSSTILQKSGLTPGSLESFAPQAEGASGPADKNPLLVALGERVRALRSRRGMTRKALSQAAEVSERHLANLEYGEGNASILVLQQVAAALQSPLAELIGDVSTSSPEWLLRSLCPLGLNTKNASAEEVARKPLSVMYPTGTQSKKLWISSPSLSSAPLQMGQKPESWFGPNTVSTSSLYCMLTRHTVLPTKWG